MKPTKHRTVSTVTQKVNEIKACIAGNPLANSKAIELLLDSVLSGIAEDSASVSRLKLIKYEGSCLIGQREP